MNEALMQLIQTVRDLSPQIWAIYLKQVYIIGTEYILVGVMLLVTFYVLLRYLKSDSKNTRYNGEPVTHWDALDEEFYKAVVIVGMASLVFFGIVMLFCAFECFANPEYVAIQKLLEVINGG